MQPQQQQMDPDAMNLAKAIRQTESGGNFNAQGKSGESGAYQWMPDTWKQHAQDALGDPNAQMTPENQNAVAYVTIKKWKDAGLNPAQIAAKWNSGSETGWENKVGTNNQGVDYNVPLYVKRVTDEYQKIKGGTLPADNTGAAPVGTGEGVTTPQAGLGDQLASRLNDASTALQQGATGNINMASAGLQTVGAAAGAVGDIVNAGLKLIPGVSSLEEGLNTIVGDLADTSVGRSVVEAGKAFAEAHPEITGDLGAALNVASVFPLFKGISLVKGAAMDAVSSTLESRLSGAATKELTEATSRTIGGRQLVEGGTKRGLNPVATIIGKPGARFLPDVVQTADGRAVYSTTDAYSHLNSTLKEDEAHLTEMLKNAHDDAGISLDQVKKETISMARQELAGNPDFTKIVGKIDADFEGIKASLGGRTYVDTKDLNDIKRMVRESVNFKSDSLDENSRYLIGQTMMKKIETTAEKNGVPGVRDFNKRMASKIEAMKVLKHLNGKAVRTAKRGGLLREGAAGLASMAGETAGNALGVPFAGTLMGRKAGTMLLNKTPGKTFSLLNRAGNQEGGLASKAKGGLLRIGTTATASSLQNK